MRLLKSIKKSVEMIKDELLTDGSYIQSEDRKLKKETYAVVGCNYYQSNIDKLRSINPEYKKRKYDDFVKVYKYNFINKPVKLVPEPKNKHDKNAIQVIIAGELVGYISREDNVHVKEILKNNDIKYISSFISGGEYKVVSLNGTTVKHDQDISIKVSIGYV